MSSHCHGDLPHGVAELHVLCPGKIHRRLLRGRTRANLGTPLSRDERHLKRFQVSRRNGAFTDGQVSVRLRAREPFDPNLISKRRARRGKEVREPGGADAGKLLQLLNEPLLELPDARPIFVPRGADVERERVVGLETGRHMRQSGIAAHEQPCSSRQHDAERDLRDDQHSLQSITAARHTAARGREKGREPASHRVDSGNEAEPNRRERAHPGGEQQRAAIDRHFRDARNRESACDRIRQPHRHQRTANAADDHEDRDFPHDDHHDLPMRRADCAADRELDRAAAQLHEHEASHVGHGNEQQQSDSSEDQKQRAPVLADPHLLEIEHHRAPVLVGLRILLTELVLVIATMVRTLRIELAPHRPVTPVGLVTIQPDSPPPFVLRPRPRT